MSGNLYFTLELRRASYVHVKKRSVKSCGACNRFSNVTAIDVTMFVKWKWIDMWHWEGAIALAHKSIDFLQLLTRQLHKLLIQLDSRLKNIFYHHNKDKESIGNIFNKFIRFDLANWASWHTFVCSLTIQYDVHKYTCWRCIWWCTWVVTTMRYSRLYN